MLPNWLYGKSLRKLQEILNSGGQTAEDVSYSNTESGLEATNAQAAIDELTEELSESSTIITENGIIATFNKWGKICTLTLAGAFNADFNYDVPFLNIPSGFVPKYNVQTLTINKPASLPDRVALNIKNDATITVAGTNVASGDALRGFCTYICR